MGNSGEGSGESAVYQEMTESSGHASRVRVALPTVRSESDKTGKLYILPCMGGCIVIVSPKT
jgi:hypothetical protein